jgi:hypothetical protein
MYGEVNARLLKRSARSRECNVGLVFNLRVKQVHESFAS